MRKSQVNHAGGDKPSEVEQAALTAYPSGQDGAGQNLLVIMLTRQIAAREWTLHDAAAALGVSYPYLQALLRGQRPISQASKTVLAAMAEFLDIPVAQAYIWSGALTAEDFFRKRSLDAELRGLYERLLAHPDFGAYAPTTQEWAALHPNLRILIAALYERATGERVLSPVSVPTEDEPAQ